MIVAEDALRGLGARALLSHETAARLHGMELVDDAGVERITVPRARHGRGVDGWVVHRADVQPADVDVRDGLACTCAARTVADLARVLPLPEAVVAGDSALRNGLVTLDSLASMARATGRGAVRLRAVHAGLDPLSGSVLESLLRVLLRHAGLPPPVTQYRIRERGHEVARVDFCWPASRLVVEADGYAFHSSRDDYRRDRRRMNELERLGWRVLRFSWEDVTQRPDHVVALVRACLRPQAVLGSAA